MPRPNKTGINWRSGSLQEKEKMREYQRRYKAENLQKVREAGRRSKLKQYGITLEEYDQMFITQDGRCAICNREQEDENLCVDHCHITDKVRGLLCRQCNRALGLFGDDPSLLFKAGEYVS